MVFEAAWGPDGAICVHRARWFETLDELAKECPDKLSHRVGLDVCGSEEQARKEWPEILLFNSSRRVRAE